MIKKIIKIKNIGKFLNFPFLGGTENYFGNTNLIFGENTYGKSTLTAIFKSLKTGNNDYIIGRKTFGSLEKQEVEILIDGKIAKFGIDFNNKNIEIFDNDFISKNVFYGDEIGKNQQGNLYNIFLDGDIKKEKSKIEILRNEKKKVEEEKKNYISKNYNISLPIEQFKKIQENKLINKEIKDKKIEIKQIKNISKIKKILTSNLFIYNFTNLKKVLSESLDISLERNIENHLSKNLTDKVKGRNFLHTGLELLKTDNCSFCGQKIQGQALELINNYKKIFSKTYNELKNNIKDKGNKFLDMDFEKEILKFKNLEFNFEDEFNLEELYDCKRKIDDKIKEKQIDLNKDLKLSTDLNFITFENIYNKIKTKINKINDDFKILKDIFVLEKELKILNYNKSRFTNTYINLFKKIDEYNNQIKILKKDINKRNITLTNKVNKIFNKNLNNINGFLIKMNSTFKLKKLKPIKNMTLTTSHYCDYSFVFDKYEVNISNRQNQKDNENEKLPHFKNTLSDSERRTLAFAFFLSKLKNDINLENKIILLDDPFSSFDENRKEKTIQLLRDIKNNNGKLPKQKFILTHEKSFFTKCYKLLPKENLKTFKIHNSITKGSVIINYNKDDFLIEEYFQNLKYIKTSCNNNSNLNEALKKVRPCLEHIIKRKYYFYLDSEMITKGSINGYLDKINAISKICKSKQEILDLNLHEEMHDNHPVMKLNEPEKINKLSDFLNLIEKI